MRRAIYPGSFDPITFGHLDIIERASKMFDEIVIGVLNNSQKNSLFSIDERVSMIHGLIADLDHVVVKSFDGLLIDFARDIDSDIIIRGLRAATDFEYELQIAQVNRVEYEGIDTVFLSASPQYSYLSSSIAREFAMYGGDLTKFVPAEIIPLIESKFNKE